MIYVISGVLLVLLIVVTALYFTKKCPDNFSMPQYWAKLLQKIPQPPNYAIVTITTGNAMWSGTNNDIYIKFKDLPKILLDKPLHDDFEKGSVMSYKVDIGSLKPADLLKFTIESHAKSGLTFDNWLLAKIKIFYKDDKIPIVDLSPNKWFSSSYDLLGMKKVVYWSN